MLPALSSGKPRVRGMMITASDILEHHDLGGGPGPEPNYPEAAKVDEPTMRT